MPTVPRKYLDNYTVKLEELSAAGQQVLGQRIAQVDYSDMTAAANDLVGIMEEFCSQVAEASAEMGRAFYEGMSVYQTGEPFDALPYSGHTAESTEKATRGIFQKAVDGNPKSMADQLLMRLDYEVKRAAGETVFQNAVRDRRYVRFARVPSGIGETCDFCIMLASRGPVYHSARLAGEGNHYHAHCRCRIVPFWDTVAFVTEAGGVIRRSANKVEGYDPDAYFDQYLDMRKAGKSWVTKSSLHRKWGGRVPSLTRMSNANRSEYFAQFMERSIGYLSDAESFEAFMERAANVGTDWKAIWDTIKDAKGSSGRAARAAYDAFWKRMKQAAAEEKARHVE